MAQDLCEKGISLQKLDIDNEQNKQMAISLNQNLTQVMKQNEKMQKKYRRAKHQLHKMKKQQLNFINEQQNILSANTVNSINDMTMLSTVNRQNQHL